MIEITNKEPQKINTIKEFWEVLNRKKYLFSGYDTEPMTWQYRINSGKVNINKLHYLETDDHLYILTKSSIIRNFKKIEKFNLECALTNSWDIKNGEITDTAMSMLNDPSGEIKISFHNIQTLVKPEDLTEKDLLTYSYNFICNSESFKNLKKSERKAVRVWSENPDLSFVYVRPHELTLEQKQQIRELRDEWLGAKTDRSDDDLGFAVVPLILNPEKHGIDLSLADGYVFLFYVSDRLVAMTYSYKRNTVISSYLGFSSRTAKGIDIYTAVKELEVWSSLYPDCCIDLDMGVSDDLNLSKFKLKLNPSKILQIK